VTEPTGDTIEKSIHGFSSHVENHKVVRQKITLGSMINRNIAEWDGLHVKITGLDDKSMIIIFTMQKSKSVRPGIIIDNVVDFSYIANAQSVLQSNVNLVYNTDNYYLLEMNSALDSINSGKHAAISGNNKISEQYHSIYNNLLEKEIDDQIAQRTTNTVYTPEQLRDLEIEMHEALLKNKEKMDQLEKTADSKFNDQFRSTFYSKYVGDVANNSSNEKIMEAINDNIHNTKCILPTSIQERSSKYESNVRLSIHYRM